MKISFKIIFILLSVLSIGVILIDFNNNNEFRIEDGLIQLIIFLLTCNVIRLLIKKFNIRIVEYLFNLAIILLNCFNFIYLGMLSWGHGFTGRRGIIIFEVGFYLNLVFFTSILFWFIKQALNETK